MKPKSPELIEILAAEYAMGLLTGRARQRFERWMMESYRVRQEVWFWERQLSPLAEQVDEVEPRPEVWQNIERRLWPSPVKSKTGFASRFWQGWSLLATAAALVLALMIGLQPRTERDWLAVVQSPQAEPLWLMNADARRAEFELKAVGAPAPGAGKDFELWILPSQGNPISVDLLPFEEGARLTIDLTREQLQELLKSKTLAISLEPKGGSPTGQPTGPVLYKTQLLKL